MGLRTRGEPSIKPFLHRGELNIFTYSVAGQLCLLIPKIGGKPALSRGIVLGTLSIFWRHLGGPLVNVLEVARSCLEAPRLELGRRRGGGGEGSLEGGWNVGGWEEGDDVEG